MKVGDRQTKKVGTNSTIAADKHILGLSSGGLDSGTVCVMR